MTDRPHLQLPFETQRWREDLLAAEARGEDTTAFFADIDLDDIDDDDIEPVLADADNHPLFDMLADAGARETLTQRLAEDEAVAAMADLDAVVDEWLQMTLVPHRDTGVHHWKLGAAYDTVLSEFGLKSPLNVEHQPQSGQLTQLASPVGSVEPDVDATCISAARSVPLTPAHLLDDDMLKWTVTLGSTDRWVVVLTNRASGRKIGLAPPPVD